MGGRLVRSMAQCLFVSQPPASERAVQMADSAGEKASGAADAEEDQSKLIPRRRHLS